MNSLLWNKMWNNWTIYCFSDKETINKRISVKKIYILEYVKKRQKPLRRFFYLASEAWRVCRILSNVKKWIKNISFTYVTLGSTFLSIMSAYRWKKYILNFKRLISLTLRDTLKRTPKVISNQNLFSRLQSRCWFWCWSWCLNFL